MPKATLRRYHSDDPEQDIASFVSYVVNASGQIHVGIDPGMSGAVALITNVPKVNPVVIDMPTLSFARITTKLGQKKKGQRHTYDLPTLYKYLDPMIEHSYAVSVCLERGQPRPEDTPVTAFSIGCGYMMWLAWVSMFGLPFEEVQPSVWKRRMGVKRDMAIGAKVNKNDSLILARRLFPGAQHYLAAKSDDGRAEALLLAEYGRRLRAGQIQKEMSDKAQ